MLGKHHLLLSLFTVTILFIPHFKDNVELTLVALIGVAVGSLIPDADSPDAAIFHSHVKGIKGNLNKVINGIFSAFFPIFGFLTKYAIYKPAVFIFGKTLLKDYDITEKHRGFLHSFIGIGTAVLLTTVYLSVFLIIIGLFNWIFFLTFILCYALGAFLHLVEDSATVSGIRFNYPFSKKTLKGNIVTRPGFTKKPDYFSGFLGVTIIALFFALELEWITIARWLLTLISVFSLAIIWLIFLFIVAGVKVE